MATIPHTENLTYPLAIIRVADNLQVASYPYSQEREALDAIFAAPKGEYLLRDIPAHYRAQQRD
jgi:hypothetical protein